MESCSEMIVPRLDRSCRSPLRLCGKTLKKLHVDNNSIEALDFGGEMAVLEELSAAGNCIVTIASEIEIIF